MDKQRQKQLFHYLAFAAAVLAWIVIMLGAYTRLRDAGLGCPDWPGCYGQLLVPSTVSAIQKAMQSFPHQPVEAAKAWAEMVHRYIAGSLGILILVLAGLAVQRYRHVKEISYLTFTLVGLVVFQALLGMLTVTKLLYPPVVMGHLLTGLTVLSLLTWLTCRTRTTNTKIPAINQLKMYRPWAIGALIILAIQIALGGWTSANYAGPACPDFPTCHGTWAQAMSFSEGFSIMPSKGINFLGGYLSIAAKAAIHMTHRLWGVVTFLYLVGFAWMLHHKTKSPRLHHLCLVVMSLACLQVGLGISYVLLQFPYGIAVMHNSIAALLLISIVALNAALYPVINYDHKKST